MAFLAAALATGCASSSSSGMTCEHCKFAVPDKKTDPPKLYCVIDGKKVDCRKTPADCPDCAKMMK
jgi:hypothetical protein